MDISLTLTTLFAQNSSAAGVFYAIINIDNDNYNFNHSLFLPVSREHANNKVVDLVSSGTYKIFSYDIESDNMVHFSAPANITDCEVINGKQ